ncbi:MAG TPA: DUF1330 domain-containing protein [Ignavibacteria bacterium]|nr:DUF1330 domain-containing protein [Ignavibacteria bacterium]HMR41135.1 DUF1330 domain-containing protein [Ignavibacteria bacterium]
MAAYIIIEIKIKDTEMFEEYKKLATDTIALYGGKYIVRGGKTEILEGNRIPNRIVILEFPSADQAKKWWSSVEYAPAMKLRNMSAESDMILVEGYIK